VVQPGLEELGADALLLQVGLHEERAQPARPIVVYGANYAADHFVLFHHGDEEAVPDARRKGLGIRDGRVLPVDESACCRAFDFAADPLVQLRQRPVERRAFLAFRWPDGHVHATLYTSPAERSPVWNSYRWRRQKSGKCSKDL
jgi:hypothetical protein